MLDIHQSQNKHMPCLTCYLPDVTALLVTAVLQGKITVKEQRNKLMYELDRTVNKSAQAGA
jgi:hypothetical protein